MAFFVLEGGYNATGLPGCAKAVITAMEGSPAFEYGRRGTPCGGIEDVAINVKRVLRPRWGVF